jgi:hypothetical protein
MPTSNSFSGAARLAVAGLAIFAFVSPVFAETETPRSSNAGFDEAIDRAIKSEQRLIQELKSRQPVVETYIQELKPDKALGAIPLRDFYFLGKLDLTNGADVGSFIPSASTMKNPLGFLAKTFKFWNTFFPEGFATELTIDKFDRDVYSFEYVRREFQGDVRCLVVDVRPVEGQKDGFIGRIWIEDRDYNIVRFSGSYGRVTKGYFHFDSWRVNSGPGLWLPAAIYTEENSYATGVLHSTATLHAQTRLWNYERQKGQPPALLTNLEVDTPDGVKDHSEQAVENSPVEMRRLWQRQSEDNVIERLQQAGLLSPAGEVEAILETVINNLEVTNNITFDPSVRVRVMPTTPLELVSVGNTIVLSRGLIDVLPDEACLAAVLAHELSHVLLGHNINTKFAFADRLTFEDRETLREASFARTEDEEEAADKKTLEILKNSPYKDKLANVGLFMRMLSLRASQMPHLIRPLMGDRLTAKNNPSRLSELIEMSPELKLEDTQQIAALPLGSRIKMDPWSDALYLLKTRSGPLVSPKEKMPFEITPVMMHLRRQDSTNVAQTSNAEVVLGQR